MPSIHPSCASIDSLVTPFIDGALSPADRQLVEHHLSRCGACRSRVAAEQSVHELMQERKSTLCHSHAPALLRSRCAAAARFSTAGTKPSANAAAPGGFGRSVASWLAPLGAAASLVVIVGGAFLYQ